jgi:hypothetical protein
MKLLSFVLIAWLFVGPLGLHAQTAAVSASPQTKEVAVAEGVNGTVFVISAGGRQNLLTRGTPLQVGDAINTTRNSTVRVRFTDGAETVVRPESTLVVQGYSYDKDAPANDNLLLNLVKGGMRALTGAIGKRGQPDAYQLKVSTAVVGIRGTDFSVRLCQQDCNDAGSAKHSNSATPVAARAVQVRGTVKVSHDGGVQIDLAEGRPVYSGDVLNTMLNSHVVLVFSDGARVVVNPSSQITVAEYVHVTSPAGGTKGSMVIDMFRGGLRFATGLIGKASPEKVKVRTATSVVGIRGTVFDAVCAPSASADSGSAADLGNMPCDESLLVQTREGTVTLSGSQGEPLVLPAGQSGRVGGPNTAARALDVAPGYFQNISTPAPESVPANMEVLFGAQALPDTSTGVLLTVHEGRVILAQAQKDILLDAGESAFAGQSAAPVRLQSTPPILDRDPFLSGSMFKANMCRR